MYKINKEIKFKQKNNEIKEISAQKVVDILYELFKPKTIVDIGCGTGLILKYFQKKGSKIMGYEGSWISKDLIKENIANEYVNIIDFENLKNYNAQEYDMCICLEVAEHISLLNADKFVNFITSHSKLVVFSAAIPNQGGFNHINEQWGEFWDFKFKQLGYEKFDILRPILWDQEDITWPYKQNLLVYSHENNKILNHELKMMPNNKLINPIHYESYINKTNKYISIITYQESIKFYFKLLIKKLLNYKS